MKYKGFVLDKFQEDAIKSVNEGNSVVVSAATGTGKTLIADYVIEKFIESGKRVIYTAPIKALSNQKFRDFREEYGDKIGLMTGDISINEHAPILIMTTEIYRNMLLDDESLIKEVVYVVFDEIHYINDLERGTVWEESVIFSPLHIRFVCLSATIPNAKEFASWIESIKDHKVDVVTYMKRAVPLKHQVFDIDLGISDYVKLKKQIELDQYPSYDPRKKGRAFKRQRVKTPRHFDLIKELALGGKLPCIYFTFSRKDCFEKAKDLHQSFTSDSEKKEIITFFNDTIGEQIKHMRSSILLKSLLQKGIGVHHAGLLPKQKEIVEKLFNRGMIKVLYATETFAVGINMPAKTVCFNALEKYDGHSFRYLTSKEYFQMAGRAGRRGIDKVGYSIAMIDRNHLDYNKVNNLVAGDDEPLVSRFQITYNTVLNLKKNHGEEEIERILKQNFGFFVQKQSKKQVRIMAMYSNRVYTLKSMNYLTEEGTLTWKGLFATHIYSNELLITELVHSGILENLTCPQVNLLLASIEYESRLSDKFKLKGADAIIEPIFKGLSKNNFVAKKIKKLNMKKMSKIFTSWSNGCDFDELLDCSSLAEGDLIRLFRRVLDVLKQIFKALDKGPLRDKVSQCMDLLDRDIVKVEF